MPQPHRQPHPCVQAHAGYPPCIARAAGERLMPPRGRTQGKMCQYVPFRPPQPDPPGAAAAGRLAAQNRRVAGRRAPAICPAHLWAPACGVATIGGATGERRTRRTTLHLPKSHPRPPEEGAEWRAVGGCPGLANRAKRRPLVLGNWSVGCVEQSLHFLGPEPGTFMSDLSFLRYQSVIICQTLYSCDRN